MSRARNVVRRIVRETRRVVRDVGSVIGSVPIVGDVAGATGLVDTPEMKMAEEAKKRAQAEQERLRQAELQRQRIEEADRKLAQQQQAISNTQTGITSSSSSYDFSNALRSGDEQLEESEDKLKKLLSRKI